MHSLNKPWESPSRCARSLTRQRGALGILGAMVLLLSILFTALAVDTGRLMMEQRRLQTVADMAALDASSQSGWCGDGSLSTAEAAAQASAARNNHPVAGDRTLEVLLGTISLGEGGVRHFMMDNPATSTAVRVTAGNTVPASLFAGGILGREATLQATAVAERRALAGFSVGSGLLSLDSEKSTVLNILLGEILGSSLDLSAVSYEGIANTNISLLSLVQAAAGVGTVNELLKAPLSVGELLQIYANAVNDSDVVALEVVAAMQTLASAAVSNAELTLGDVLAVTAPNVEQAASVEVNLLDLLTTTALVANGDNALTLPLNFGLPGGLALNTVLYVIELPQLAIGPPGMDVDGNCRTEAKTAQVRLDLTAQGSLVKSVVGGLIGEGLLADLLNGLFNLLGALLDSSDLIDVDVLINLAVEVAQGRACLESIQCAGPGSPNSLVTIGVEKGIASVDLDVLVTLNLKVVRLLLFPSYEDIQVPLSLSLNLSDAIEESLQFEVGTLPQIQRADSNVGQSLANALEDENLVNVAGVDLNSLGIAAGLVRIILAAVAPVLDALLSVLGVEIGYADVKLIDLDSGRPDLLI
ncbi:TadG family pilus assembly protein [Methylotuvimicrobium alcaliphilum]|nr:TadG family pilus assembly protein [Methylotuvimicrobium alcaliphilum]